jgi:acetate kinase
MSNAFAVINAGSSSIKFSVFKAAGFEPLISGQIEGLYTHPHFIVKGPDRVTLQEHTWAEGTELGHQAGVAYLLEMLPARLTGHELTAVGHRIVHGGTEFAQPVVLTPAVLDALDAFIPLAPLHQPHNIAPVRALFEQAPGLPQVGCFDTAFHTTNPPVAQAFALPAEIQDAGVRRYGFHGLSYEYIAAQLPSVDPRAAAGKTVVLHLGNGASMCALQSGVSMASTMGFTALDGLPMGTRCGSIDAGVILWLMDQRGMGARQIEKLLYSQSGLLGVSGVSSDMRTLLDSDEPRARLAVDLFVYRIGRELGSLAAALGGLDAVVFTAGIGEHAAPIRERVCRAAAWLGLDLDASANNANARGNRCISTAASKVSAWVIPTNEELMIARHTADLVPA